jgi:microcystin-dependent protein
MPAHNHTLLASGTGGNSEVPTDGILAKSTDTIYQAPPVPDTTLAANAVQPTGGSQPHNNMQPYLGLNYIIALEGIFPSRN